LQLHLNTNKQQVDSVTVDMLEPKLDVPAQYTGSAPDLSEFHLPLIKDASVHPTFVSMGNPHFVIFLDKEQIKEFYKQDPVSAKAQFGDDPFELKNILKYWVRSKNADSHVIPTDTIYMTIDKEAVRRSGMMRPGDSIPDRMVISLAGKQALYKNDLMMLEMIANCNWTRPLYVAVTVGAENFMNLGENFIQEGLVNRITPFSTMDNANSTGINMRNFDTEKTYDVMMNRFKWGGLSKPGLYIDETVARMCYTHRREMADLALHLITKGEKTKALKVLQISK